MSLKILLGMLLVGNILSAASIVGGSDKSLKKDNILMIQKVENNAPGLTLLGNFTGQYGVSTDGFGSVSQEGVISAMIPSGSTIIKAYLYSAGYSFSTADNIDLEGLSFNGQAVSFEKYYENPWTGGYFKTGRADVTAIVKSVYNNETSDNIYNFSINEKASSVDGEGLVVVYSHPSLPISTISIIDGGANINGDSFSLVFEDPIDKNDVNFMFDMYMGISFSAGGQSSKITVNDQILTENAGDYDDGSGSNGALITVGGFNDIYSPLNPSYADDHEKYNLINLVNTGDTEIKIDTINPSQDDNIFLIIMKTSDKSDTVVECDLNSAYDDGFEAGVNYCKTNPSSCGVHSGVVVIPL